MKIHVSKSSSTHVTCMSKWSGLRIYLDSMHILSSSAEPSTSSLRCGVVSALTSKSDSAHFKTLPTRRNLERLHLASVGPAATPPGPGDAVDGSYPGHAPQYATRMSR